MVGEAASSSTDPKQPKEEERKGVQREDQEAQKMRKQAKHTIFLVGEILATDVLPQLTRLIWRLVQPLFHNHSYTAESLRSPHSTQQYHLEMARGTWLLMLDGVAQKMQDLDKTLSRAGCATSWDGDTWKGKKRSTTLLFSRMTVKLRKQGLLSSISWCGQPRAICGTAIPTLACLHC